MSEVGNSRLRNGGMGGMDY